MGPAQRQRGLLGHAILSPRPRPLPVDLTKVELDAYVEAHPTEKAALLSPYSVVRRDGAKLVAIPYSRYYAQWLEPAARLLEQAAKITSNPSLRTFLMLRAKAFGPMIISSPSSPGWT